MLGDTTSFYIGRRLGRGFLEQHGPRVKITHERLEQVEGYFDRHGGKTILIGRFIGLVRALAPFIAGASGLAYRRFIPYSVVGTGAVGDALLRARLHLLALVRQGRARRRPGACSASGSPSAVIVGVVVAYRRRGEIQRLAARRTSATRWSGRCSSIGAARCTGWVVRPLVRVVVTPQAALRLRTGSRRASSGSSSPRSLAIAGVGLYVFVALRRCILAGDPGPDAVRQRSCSTWPTDLHNDDARRRREGGHEPGRAPTVHRARRGHERRCSIVRRRYAEALVLVVGFVLIYVAVHVTKDAHRPAAAHRLAGRHDRRRVPERPRRVLDGVGGRRRGARRGGCGW